MKNNRHIFFFLLILAIVVISCKKSSDTTTDPTPSLTPASSSNFYTRSSIHIGAQGNSFYPNYYDADSNVGYAMNFYDTKKTLIDLVYYYDDNGSETFTLSSPNNSMLTTVNNYFGYISSSSVVLANNTLIKKLTGFTVSGFDNIADSAAIRAAYDGIGTVSNRAVNLAIGNIIAFKSTSGKIGMLKVTDIYPPPPATGSTSVEFVLKYQK